MSFEIKTYKDSYLYNNKITKANQAGGSKNNAVLKDFIMNAHRVEDKQAESFRGILEDVKRQQMSSVLYTVLLLDNVQICINKSELPRAFKVFEAKDVLNGKKSTVFIDCTGLIEYKNGYYYCRKVDVFVTYLLEALIYILYRNANMKIMNNSNVTINATECYVSMFNFVLDYLRIIGYSENKNKISYLVALFFLTNMMSKPLDNYARSVAAAISGIDKKNIEAFNLYIDDGMFDDIDCFVTSIAHTFKLKGFTTEVFVSKWIYRFNIGTQYGCELFTSFANILACTYVGSYIVNQNQVEKCCGTAMVKFINEILKVGTNTLTNASMRESAISFKNKNTLELAKAANNKEATKFKGKITKSNFMTGQVNPLIKTHLKECAETYQSNMTIGKYVDNVMEAGLDSITSYAKNNEQCYQEGALLEAVQALNGSFSEKQLYKLPIQIESAIQDLREYCNSEELEECVDDKRRISRCVRELMECSYTMR